MYFEAAGALEGIVDEVGSVCHADDEDVVERIDPIDFRQQLIDDLQFKLATTQLRDMLMSSDKT